MTCVRVLVLTCFSLIALLGPKSSCHAATVRAGDIIVVDQSAFGGPGGVIRVDPVTSVQEVVSSGGLLVDPRGVAIDSCGDIIVADPSAFGGGGGVIRVDPVTGAQSAISSGGLFVDPLAVTLDAAGNLLVADAGASGSGAIIRVDPMTGAQVLVSAGGLFVDPHGVAVDLAGTIIVSEHDIDGGSTGAVIKVDPASGVQTLLSYGDNLIRTVHVTLDAAGQIIVASLGFDGPLAGIIRVDPGSGSQAAITLEDLLVSPAGVAIGASGSIIVADVNAFGGNGGVIEVDAVTGAQVEISSGGFFADPQGVAVVPARSEVETWLGLKNSDDQGTSFDIRSELYVNGILASESQALCVTGITRNPAKARQVCNALSAMPPASLSPGDNISLRVLTRIGTNADGTKCPGHSNALGLRLYYDALTRPSRVSVETPPDPRMDFFLRRVGSDLVLNSAAPTSSQPKQQDSGPVNFIGGNPWVEVGTWDGIVP